MLKWRHAVTCAAVGLALVACKKESTQEQTASTATSSTSTYAAPAVDTTAQPPVATATTPPPMTPADNPLRIAPGMPTALPRVAPQATATTPIENMEEAIARVPRITPDELKEEVDSGKAVVIDVRGPAFFTGHIAGAENIPEAQLPMVMAQLPRDKKIVTYCT